MDIILVIALAVSVIAVIYLLLSRTRLISARDTLAAEKQHLADTVQSLTALKADLAAAEAECNRLGKEIVAAQTESQQSGRLLEQLRAEIADLKKRLADSAEQNSRLLADNAALQTRLDFFTSQKQAMEEENANRFKALAAEVLKSNSDSLKSQHENRLTELLTPLRDNIEQFKKTFAESYEKESRERFALDKHIQELVALNQNIGNEARELSRALRGNSKIQGDWGEMILQSILERSGLEKGREFVIQESVTSDEGSRLRADVVVNYPDGRCAVIDSKVSLTDYVRSVNADNAKDRQTFLDAHTRSVRKHIDELRNKNYQDYIGDRKADFVMMFIPNEGAYIAAMQHDGDLWQYAYDNRVVVISPTHLISVMKLLEQLWQHDRQSRNAVEIARKAGTMYDKFVGFIGDLAKIRKAIDGASAAYEESIKKLSTGKGNLVKSAADLKAMGAKAQKSLPENYTGEAEITDPGKEAE